MKKILLAMLICIVFGSLSLANSGYSPFDPVIGLYYHFAQIAFEKAPAALVKSCSDPVRNEFWIYAQTSRPEGTYMVIAGPTWVTPDTATPAKPILDPIDPYGEIILVKNGTCRGLWDPDAVFNAPTSQQSKIADDLAGNLITRAVRAYGGKANLLAALAVQNIKTSDLAPILRPLVESLRDP